MNLRAYEKSNSEIDKRLQGGIYVATNVLAGILAGGLSPALVMIGLLSLIAGVQLLVHPLTAAMFFVITKPIVDATWFIKIPFGGLDISLQRALGVILPGFGALTIMLYSLSGRKFQLPLSSLILFFSFFASVSIVQSPLPVQALIELSKLLGGFVFYYLGCLYFTSESRFKKFIQIYMLCALFPAITVILQQVGIIDLTDWGVEQQQLAWVLGHLQNRYAGLYNDAATTSIFMLIGLPFAFCCYTYWHNSENRPFYIFIVMLFCYAMVISWIRIVWIALACQFIVWFFMNRNYKVLYGLLGGLGCVVLYKFQWVLGAIDWQVMFRPEGLSGKVGYWIIIVKHYLNAGFITHLFGEGLYANVHILRTVESLEFGNIKYLFGEDWGGKAHSDIVEFLIDLGLVGLVSYILLIFLLGYKVWHLRKLVKTIFYQKLINAWFCVFSTYILYSLIGNSSRYPAMTWLLWFVAGGLLSILKKEKRV